MNEKLKSFFNEHKAQDEGKKAEFLISLGLYEREYSSNSTYSVDYPCIEWDEEEKKQKYYKKVAIEVTDEEYAEVKRCINSENVDKKNPVAIALIAIAWIVFVVGFILGIVLGTEEVVYRYRTETEFSFAVAMVYWVVSLVSGIMILGFAEIIKLLESIKNKK